MVNLQNAVTYFYQMDNKVDYSMTMNEREIKNSSNQKSGRP